MTDAQLICLLKAEIQDLEDQLAAQTSAPVAPFSGVEWRGHDKIGTIRPHRGGFRVQLRTAGVLIQSNTIRTEEQAQAWLDAIVDDLDIPAYRAKMTSDHAEMRRRMIAMRERIKAREEERAYAWREMRMEVSA